MKTNLKAGIWLVAAMMIGFSTFAQGKHKHNRHDREDDDCYEDQYRHGPKGRGGDNQHYRTVKQRPPAYYHGKIPGRPSPAHTWIDGEYRWHRGGYVYSPGYWVTPPRKGMRYVPGYWQPVRSGGYVWISGFWQGANTNPGGDYSKGPNHLY